MRTIANNTLENFKTALADNFPLAVDAFSRLKRILTGGDAIVRLKQTLQAWLCSACL